MKNKTISYSRLCFYLCCLITGLVNAQTLGLLQNDQNSLSGYTLFAKAGNTYLIDNGGQVVHTWDNGSQSTHPGYLMDNGDLIVVNSGVLVDRGVKRIDWDSNLVWQYVNAGAHHDVAVLPNGNVLLLIHGDKTNAEAIAAGRNSPIKTIGTGSPPLCLTYLQP